MNPLTFQSQAQTTTNPERVICIDDANLDRDSIWPNGPVEKGKTYHVLHSTFSQRPGFALLGFPSLCPRSGVDVGFAQFRFRVLR